MLEDNALSSFFSCDFRGFTKVFLRLKAMLFILQIWELIMLQKRYRSLLSFRKDVEVFKLYLSRSVKIEVSCLVRDKFVAQDGQLRWFHFYFLLSKYSRISLYITRYLLYLDTLSNQKINQSSHYINHTFQNIFLLNYVLWVLLE